MANAPTTLALILLTLLAVAAGGVAIDRLRRPTAPDRGRARLQGVLIAAVGLGSLGVYLYRWLAEHGRWQPLIAHVDGLLLIAALLAGAVLFIQTRPRLFGLSAFATPLLVLILAWAVCASAWTYRPFDLETLHPVWKAVHLGGVYLGTLSSAIAAVAGGMYLFVQSRLKRKADLRLLGTLASLETLETLIIRAATLGFVLLTVGLASGAVILSDEGAGGDALYFTIKIGLAAGAWLVYALLMNVRYATSFRGARAAWLSIAGLVLLLATYGLVNAVPDARRHAPRDAGAMAVTQAVAAETRACRPPRVTPHALEGGC